MVSVSDQHLPEESMVPVSPSYNIELDESVQWMLQSPHEQDYVLRKLSDKSVNGLPLIQGELVIAGSQTREEFPLAEKYPVHFRKTYYPICFHQDPRREFDNQLAASKIIDAPPPIGSSRTTFRSCFQPGIPFDRLSPLGIEPEEQNIQVANDLDTAAAIGLWFLLESVYGQVLRLHENGFAHGDLFLHNVIISRAPIAAHLIDFELAIRRDGDLDEQAWREKCAADLAEIFRHAAYLQCFLGRQGAGLGDASLGALPGLLGDADRFLRAISRNSVRQ